MRPTMKIAKFMSLVGCLLLAVVSTGQLHAVPNTMINGSASFAGGTSASGPSGGGLTTMFFSPNWSFLAGTGTYAGIPQTSANFTSSFSFTGDGNGAVLSAPVIDFWSFTSGGNVYSFELSALTNGHVQANAMSFTGTGTLFATGYDPTPATFSMNGTGENFAFQLSFVTNTATGNNVPDTGPTILLLSCSMVALLVCWRRLERPTLAVQTRKR
jgi:hypothetical protein